jgi:parvulin-like peptidyl-prolyl isomerase
VFRLTRVARVTRVARIAAGTAAAVLVTLGLTGCDTSPGAAALVGSDRISVASLQAAVNRALADPAAQQQLGQDRLGFTRTQLARLVNNIVIVHLAAADHLTASATDVDQQLASFAQQAGGQKQLLTQAAAGGVPAKDLPGFVRYFVLQQKIADKLAATVTVSQAQLQAAYQKNIDQFDQVDSAHILVATKALADSIFAQVKAKPSMFAALAKRYSIDTGSKNSGGALGYQPASQLVKPFATAIFAAKPGSYVEVHSQFGWHVIHVIAHKKVSLDQAAPQLTSGIVAPERQKLLQAALAAEGRKLGVHVNPRYGRWNAAAGTIVAPAGNSQLSSPAPTPSS